MQEIEKEIARLRAQNEYLKRRNGVLALMLIKRLEDESKEGIICADTGRFVCVPQDIMCRAGSASEFSDNSLSQILKRHEI